MAIQLVCTSCGSVGKPRTVVPGSFLIEIVLWLFFLLPGLCYTVWRLSAKHKACPACGGKAMVPTGSPVGRQLLAKQGA